MIPAEVKILHCADFHLGSDMPKLGNRAFDRKNENFRAFEKIIDLCKNEKVDFLLIAGDLFDRINVSETLVDQVMALVASVSDTVVAISPGNHDPYSIDSYYHLKSWPKNTIIFSDKLRCVPYADKGVCIWGAGFIGTYAENLWDSADTQNLPDLNLINICVMHGDIMTSSSSGKYNPIPVQFIEQFGFDYIALGHIHKRTPISRMSKTHYAYAGSPDGHGFDEIGELGVYLGFIGKSYHKLSFQKVNTRSFLEVRIEVGDYTSNSVLADNIVAELKKRFPSSYHTDFFKIVLTGSLPDNVRIDTVGIEERIAQQLYFVKIVNDTTSIVEYNEITSENSLKGIFAKKMIDSVDETIDSVNKELMMLGLRYGLNAFEGEVIIDDYNSNLD